MINENQVVDYVCKYLEDNKYTNIVRKYTNQRGYDIVAFDDVGKRLIIEAKGGTSSKVGTNRHGKDFDSKQVGHHVAMALYAASNAIDSDPDCKVGIALPQNYEHIKAVNKIQRVIELLGIKIYWVYDNGDVTVI